MKKKDVPVEMEESDSEFQAVFSDLMSFLTGLFILLFTIVNNQKSQPSYFAEMGIKFGGEIVEQEQKVTSEAKLVSDVRNYIQDEQLSQYAMVLVDEQKIRLVLNDPIIFQSGTDILTQKSQLILNGLMNIVTSVLNPIIIEGHTDDIPVKGNGKYRSNWDMGYFRASTVANYFIKRGVDPRRISIATYGEHRPIAARKTALARRKNRRIEISIIRIKEAEE